MEDTLALMVASLLASLACLLLRRRRRVPDGGRGMGGWRRLTVYIGGEGCGTLVGVIGSRREHGGLGPYVGHWSWRPPVYHYIDFYFILCRTLYCKLRRTKLFVGLIISSLKL